VVIPIVVMIHIVVIRRRWVMIAMMVGATRQPQHDHTSQKNGCKRFQFRHSVSLLVQDVSQCSEMQGRQQV
jgi:hypothetical protein